MTATEADTRTRYRQARDQLRLAIRALTRASTNFDDIGYHVDAEELHSCVQGLVKQLGRLTPPSN